MQNALRVLASTYPVLVETALLSWETNKGSVQFTPSSFKEHFLWRDGQVEVTAHGGGSLGFPDLSVTTRVPIPPRQGHSF